MNQPLYIIGEAGVNHNGSLELAKELVHAAAAAGVDAVKFQTFKAESLVTKSARKAEYQIRNIGGEDNSQFAMLKALELSEEAHVELEALASRLGVEFISTPFDFSSVRLLAKLGVKRLKVSSGDLTNAPLLLAMAQTDLPIILSTGMSTLGEVEEALSVIAWGYCNRSGGTPSKEQFRRAYASEFGQSALKQKVTLLHCTSQYPAPFDSINLKAMDTLTAAFGLPVGLSDHSLGSTIPIAATARGARMIEKHFTLNRELPGPDHKASLEPAELKQMVEAIRNVEAALGNGVKVVQSAEFDTRAVAVKSLVAATEIAPGDRFSEANVTVKRPGTGLPPIQLWEVLGREAKKSFQPDEFITL